MALPVAVVNSRGRARILAGHPWVFRQDIERGPETDAGTGGPALVAVVDARGRALGIASWAVQAKLALRMFDRSAQAPRELPDLVEIVAARLGAAAARRGGMARRRDAYRLVHGEADALPGLFIDVYADAAVMQTTSVAMDAARVRIADLLLRRLDARIVIARDDGSTRDFEGLPRVARIEAGQGATRVVYHLGENAFEADLLVDGKTGGFLDQADNHATVAALAPRGGRCLDAFTYHGGFALPLARLGGQVLATDEDAAAVARATANAARNQLANLEVRQANAFDLLRELESAGERFDVVVLDPPAFAKRGGARTGTDAAERAYKEIILRGLRITEAGGLCVACSCSGRMARAGFDEVVAAAAADSGRMVQILARRGAGQDHPELAGVPETAHLKCWLLRVL